MSAYTQNYEEPYKKLLTQYNKDERQMQEI